MPTLHTAAALALLLVSCFAYGFEGRVVHVQDGDTLTVLVERRQVKVRLASIDAPERKQAFGARSRQSLAEICAGKVAQVDDRGSDHYGRTIGQVTCASVDANAEQVRRGMAWVYERYAPKGSPLYAIQAEAQGGRRGLWSGAQPVPPWDWRENARRRGH